MSNTGKPLVEVPFAEIEAGMNVIDTATLNEGKVVRTYAKGESILSQAGDLIEIEWKEKIEWAGDDNRTCKIHSNYSDVDVA